MVKRMLVGLGVFMVIHANAQSPQNFSKNGLLKSDLSYAQSYMLHYSNQNVYLCGVLEYFTSDKLSIRGDCFWYLDSRQTDKRFKQNALVLFGVMYNFPFGKSNFYVGLQPGFSFTTPNDLQNNEVRYTTSFLPALCISTGYTLFFSKFCSFNLGVKYLSSRYRGTPNASINLDEFLISGGLGFQLQTKKHK